MHWPLIERQGNVAAWCMNFTDPQRLTFALIEFLEPRRLLSVSFEFTQVSSLPNRRWEYGPSNLTAFGSDLLFQAGSPSTHRQAIWISDGARKGTRQLKIALKGDHLLVGTSENQIYFAVPSTPIILNSFSELSPQPAELYVTSDMGKTFTDLGLVPQGVGFGSSVVDAGKFYFTTDTQLWVSDSTRTGTYGLSSVTLSEGELDKLSAFGDDILVQSPYTVAGIFTVNLLTGSQQFIGTGNVANPVVFNNKIYFLGSTASEGNSDNPITSALYISDGTSAGTIDLYADADDANELPGLQALAVLGNHLLLFGIPNLGAGASGTNGDSELYSCDGSITSIAPVALLTPLISVASSEAADDVVADEPIEYDDQVIFQTLSDSGEGTELWVTDGSSLDTRPVLEYFDPASLVATNGMLYSSSADVVESPKLLGSYTPGNIQPGQVFVNSISGISFSQLEPQIVDSSFTSGFAGAPSTSNIQIKITNIGNQNSSGVYTVQVGFCSDMVGSDFSAIRTVKLRLALAPGANWSMTLPFFKLPTVAADEYHIAVKIAAPDQALTQTISQDQYQIESPIAVVNLSEITSADGTGMIDFALNNVGKTALSQIDDLTVGLGGDPGHESYLQLLDETIHVRLLPGQSREMTLSIANLEAAESLVAAASLSNELFVQISTDVSAVVLAKTATIAH